MATTDRSTTSGAVTSSSNTYTSRGVFNSNEETIAEESGGSGTTIPATTITGGGTGGNANNATITLTAGGGINGGGDFTTNQAIDEAIAFSLPLTFVPGTGQSAGTAIGNADNPVQSITVDQYGRVSSVTVQTATPLPTPFNDQFSATGDTSPLRASESPTMETVTLSVADGFTLSDITTSSTGTGITVGQPVLNVDMDEATIDVTIPATDATTTDGTTYSVTTMSTVTETSTGRSMPETATPLSRTLFIPFYQMIFDSQQSTLSLSSLTESTSALTNGTMVSFTYNTSGSRRQYSYLALERIEGRTYRFDAGFFDISTDPTGQTAEMFGRTFDFYEFPTQADLSFTIRW